MTFSNIFGYLINFKCGNFIIKLEINFLHKSFQFLIYFRVLSLKQVNDRHFFKLRCYELIDIYQTVSRFGTIISTISFLEYNIFALHTDCMIIKTPPTSSLSIKYEGKIVSTVCITLMNHYCMQVVRAIFRLQESCFQLIFVSLKLFFKILNLFFNS